MTTIKLCIAAALALTMASCSDSNQQDNVTNDKDTMVLKSADQASGTPEAEDAWARVDWNSPVVKYDEVKSSDVSIRGNEQYGIYGLGENVLFETGKAEIRPAAMDNLTQIAGSINQRYSEGKVKVYGYTDATGAADANEALSRQRADAVKNFLSGKGNIAADRITMRAEGESRPVASNDNAAGREQNRRVEIVAMKK